MTGANCVSQFPICSNQGNVCSDGSANSPCIDTSECRDGNDCTNFVCTSPSCFPLSGQVTTLEHGVAMHKTMGALRIGDLVRAVDAASGALTWSLVFGDPHRSATTPALFVHLQMRTATLRLSPLHFLPVSPLGCNGSDLASTEWFISARVALGAGVWVAPPGASVAHCEVVLSTSIIEEVGYAHPLTLDFTIVVDGVVATTVALHPAAWRHFPAELGGGSSSPQLVGTTSLIKKFLPIIHWPLIAFYYILMMLPIPLSVRDAALSAAFHARFFAHTLGLPLFMTRIVMLFPDALFLCFAVCVIVKVVRRLLSCIESFKNTGLKTA